MIQRIRHATGINEEGGGHPEVREMRYFNGINTAQRAPLYRVSPDRITMAAMGDATSDPAFAGCTNDTQLSFFLGKLALSWALRGLVGGLAIGAVGTAVGLYLLNKRGR